MTTLTTWKDSTAQEGDYRVDLEVLTRITVIGEDPLTCLNLGILFQLPGGDLSGRKGDRTTRGSSASRGPKDDEVDPATARGPGDDEVDPGGG